MAKKTAFKEMLGVADQGDRQLCFLGEAAYLWMYLQNNEKAAQVFDGLTLIAPNDPVGHLGLAEVYLRQGRHREAERAATKAARSKNVSRRTMAYAYVVLGQAYAGQEKVKEAERAWERAIELDADADEAAVARSWIETTRTVSRTGGKQTGVDRLSADRVVSRGSPTQGMKS